MRVKVKGDNDFVTLVGNLLEVPAGSVLLCEGNWKVDKRYGNQFVVESWEKQKDIKNVMLFLQSYGVSTAYAAKIYRQYGKESIDTVKANPYKLADDIWVSVCWRPMKTPFVRQWQKCYRTKI